MVPLATGMALTLTLLTLKQIHYDKPPHNTTENKEQTKQPEDSKKEGEGGETKEEEEVVNLDEDVVIWPRIDQKSCLKCIRTAGFRPLPIALTARDDELRTDLDALERALRARTASRGCIIVMTTTSCFAPRAPDRVVEVAELCKKYGVPHVVNNAYGLQDKYV